MGLPVSKARRGHQVSWSWITGSSELPLVDVDADPNADAHAGVDTDVGN